MGHVIRRCLWATVLLSGAMSGISIGEVQPIQMPKHILPPLTQPEVRQIREGGPTVDGIVRALPRSLSFSNVTSSMLSPHRVNIGGGVLRLVTDEEDVRAVWVAYIQSPGAREVRVFLSSGYLPEGCDIYIRNESGEVFGPYRFDGQIHENGFWSNTLLSDHVYVELHVSSTALDLLTSIQLQITKIAHIVDVSSESEHYTKTKTRLHESSSSKDQLAKSTTLGTDPAKASLEDVNCGYAKEFAHIDKLKSATVHIRYVKDGETGVASGALLRNHRADSQPFVLTANHAISSQTVAEHTEYRFDFRTSSCGGSALSGSRMIGANLVSTSATTDFTLLLLKKKPPEPRVYLDWSLDAVGGGTVLHAVHHPWGQLQSYTRATKKNAAPECFKFGFGYGPALGGPNYYANIEGGGFRNGSSGGVVVNPDGLVVGHLVARCGSFGSYSAVVGRFDKSFNDNNLSFWLESGALATIGGSQASSFDFGERTAGTPGIPAAFEVRNTSTITDGLNLEVGPAYITGSDSDEFSVVDGASLYLPPSERGTIIFEFRPKSVGAKRATLVIPHTASNAPSPRVLTITGTGIPGPSNPLPTISSLSPSSKTAGAAAFTLTVNGEGFVEGSVVRWNGAARPTTYHSATRLSATIAAADIATAGTASVTVFNPEPGGGTSNSKLFTINSGQDPATPTATAATNVTTNSFTANWNSAEGATGYILSVFSEGSGWENRNVGNVTSQDVAGLEPWTTRFYVVTAYNSGGQSGTSNVVQVTTLPNPFPTPMSTGASDVTETSFTANWSSVGDATGYLLDVSVDSIFTSYVRRYQNRDVGNVTSHNVTGLTAGTTYYYRVRACNYEKGARSVYSGSVVVKTLPKALPRLVSPMDGSMVSVTPTLTWTPVQDAAYQQLSVFAQPDFSTCVTGSQYDPTVTSCELGGLLGGVTYYWRVGARIGNSTVYSEARSFTTEKVEEIGEMWCLCVPPWGDQVVYAAADTLFKSTDGGCTWGKAASLRVGGRPFTAIWVSPTDTMVVYTATYRGVYWSVNGGLSWDGVSYQSMGGYVRSLSGSLKNGNVVYAATGGGVSKTVNGGRSWIAANNGLTDPNVYAIAVIPENDQNVFAATTGSVFRSLDGGESWVSVFDSPSKSTYMFLGVSETGEHVYLHRHGEGMFKSTDRGISWTYLSGLETVSGYGEDVKYAIDAIGISPWDHKAVFASVGAWGLLRSSDGGFSWTRVLPLGDNESVWAIQFSWQDEQLIYVAATGGVLKSPDGGNTWIDTSTGTIRSNIAAGAIALNLVDVNRDQISIDIVAIYGSQGKRGVEIRLKYNPSDLQFIGYEPRDLMEKAAPIVNDKDGVVTIAAAILGGEIAQDSGNLGCATFEAQERFEGETWVELIAATFDGPPLSLDPEKSLVIFQIQPAKPCPDFDGDGIVGFPDFIQFAQVFGAVKGDTRYNGKFDLDQNDRIGFPDFIQFAQAFGKPASEVSKPARAAKSIGLHTSP